MAHSTFNISSIGEIPDAVRTFASSMGFSTVDGDPILVRHPTYAAAKNFSVGVSVTGEGTRTHRERLLVGVQGVGSPSEAILESPKFNPSGTANSDSLVVQQPTLLRLFGNLETAGGQPGSSWIAGVVEYGFNLYRHFYLGYIQKVTSFIGGEVVTGSAQIYDDEASLSLRGDRSDISMFPFSLSNPFGDGQGGGAFIDHPENGAPWRVFYAPTSGNNDLDVALSSTGNRCILGGFSDSINSGYLTAGKSPFSGTQILTPINLYIGHRLEPNQYFRAVGAPAGVRMVHLEDLEPGATVLVGAQEWMVFPVFSKQTTFTVRRHGTSGSNPPVGYRYPYMNSSQYVGMAYLMNE